MDQATYQLTERERTQLLDWVTACQSAYHIKSTPGHRFGFLPSNLEENRSGVVDFVNHVLASRAVAKPPQPCTVCATPAAVPDDVAKNAVRWAALDQYNAWADAALAVCGGVFDIGGHAPEDDEQLIGDASDGCGQPVGNDDDEA